ncbi:MAG: hypothetical protein QM784_11030 [Polyangiaceae bacterium]
MQNGITVRVLFGWLVSSVVATAFAQGTSQHVAPSDTSQSPDATTHKDGELDESATHINATGSETAATVDERPPRSTEPSSSAESTNGKTSTLDVGSRHTTGSYGGPIVEDEDQWKFGYNGYLRAPLRVGIASRDVAYAGQSKTTFHAPLIPDDQYLSWQSTKHNRRDWAELFFSYGNSWAKGVVALQGFNFTDASAVQNGAQFGIGQGWIRAFAISAVGESSTKSQDR